MQQVTARDLAKIIGVSEQRVGQLKKEGIITPDPDRQKYDLTKAVPAYIAYKTASMTTDEDGDHALRKAKADADLQEAKAAQEQLKLAELKGTMHSRMDVMVVLEEMVFAIKGILLAIPGRTAMDLASATTALECERIVRDEIYKGLEELTNHRYDPTRFKKMVMERAKWMKEGAADEAGKADGPTGATRKPGRKSKR